MFNQCKFKPDCLDNIEKFGYLSCYNPPFYYDWGCEIAERYIKKRKNNPKTRLQYTVNRTVNNSKVLEHKDLEKKVSFCTEKQLCLF